MPRQPFSGTSPEVLIVDDNPQDLQLLGEAFAECGVPAHLHHAHDGGQAIERIAKQGRFANAPDIELIILDLNMPRLDGRAMLGRLMDHPGWRGIPTVVLTSSSRSADIDFCSQMGALWYYVKPATWDDYLAMVRSLKSLFTPGAAASPDRTHGAPVSPAPSPSSASEASTRILPRQA